MLLNIGPCSDSDPFHDINTLAFISRSLPLAEDFRLISFYENSCLRKKLLYLTGQRSFNTEMSHNVFHAA